MALLAGGAVIALTSGGCGGVGQPAPYDSQGIDGLVIPTPTPDVADFVTRIDNPWLSWESGATWTYDVTREGARIGSMQTLVLSDTTEIAGLIATGVRTTTNISDEEETVTRFYAQDRDGNVWWVGQDSAALTWRAGSAGAEAGLAMPASPRLGDGWVPYVVAQGPSPSVLVEAQSRDRVNTRDEDDSVTLKSYRTGVGLDGVENLEAGWRADLIDRQPD